MPLYFYILSSILAPLTYFYFNWRYFALIATTLRRDRMKKGAVLASFFFNYILFFVCSVLELNLIVNWGVFFLFLLGETCIYCRGAWRSAFLFTLIGILSGLAINIFCRCAVSIAIAQPLADFDNNVSSGANLKGVPVWLGFTLGGALFHLMAGSTAVKRFRVLLAHPDHLNFLLEVMGGMFLYLFLNLLIYQAQDNGVLLKLWGVKSCVFTMMGTYLGIRYTLQMCERSDYQDQNRLIQRELLQKAKEEEALRAEAYRDTLTGCYNRQYAGEAVVRLLEGGRQFSLCFVDLDHLKRVNDQFGHIEGDQYLVYAARELARVCRKDQDLLFRYGGDEFLVVFRDISAEAAEARADQASRNLREISGTGEVPFPMSLSYGAVDSADSGDYDGLINLADAKMYRRKRARTEG